MKNALAIFTVLSLAAAADCVTPPSRAGASAAGVERVERKVTFETVVGAVKAYVPGKRIVLVTSQDRVREFEIEQTAEVVGKIAIGQPAKVEYFKSSDGPERVLTIAEAPARAAR